MSCKRGNFWPLPYSEIKNKTGGILMVGGCFSNYQQIQCQQVQNWNVWQQFDNSNEHVDMKWCKVQNVYLLAYFLIDTMPRCSTLIEGTRAYQKPWHSSFSFSYQKPWYLTFSRKGIWTQFLFFFIPKTMIFNIKKKGDLDTVSFLFHTKNHDI